jgi:SAM-dependent methyltransferase
MGGVEDQVGRQPQYEAFADEFLDHAEHSLFNAYYDRPACLDLLGDVTGKRVLDAACGPGLYAAELLRRGASVVGFDHSPRMIEICRERAGQGDFRVHDLGNPITWLPDASVDLALCVAIQHHHQLRAGDDQKGQARAALAAAERIRAERDAMSADEVRSELKEQHGSGEME